MTESVAALELEGVSAGYGETVVLEEVDFSLAPGEAVSIIGRNGVGKTTLLATVMGHTTLHSGTIRLNGADTSTQKPYRRVWQGLGYVPQEREIFPSLTVLENLAVATRHKSATNERVFGLFPQLHERRQTLAGYLSGGEQQMLAVARALVGNPSILLMDEPSEGLAPRVVELLQEVILRLRDEESIAIVLVEQRSQIALDFAERCIVMNRGRIIRECASRELRADAALLHRLIGVDAGNEE